MKPPTAARHIRKAAARRLRRIRAATTERVDPGYPPAVLRWLADERKGTPASFARPQRRGLAE